jgi:uncharacterized protein YqjF (DUF2071 family)
MLNYRVPPELLQRFVPDGTELDLWEGAAYVSVVGFLFRDTRLLGLAIPFHRTFEEVNLRFYVRRPVRGEIRRGVTFVRELVPRAAIAVVARLAYNEPYRALPMSHSIDLPSPETSGRLVVSYEWDGSFGRAGVHVAAHGEAAPVRPGSEEEFITHHSWGYTRQRNGSTVEYEVRHPSWHVWRADSARVDGNVSDVYPPELSAVLQRPPDSALLADGSAVTVHVPSRLTGRA